MNIRVTKVFSGKKVLLIGGPGNITRGTVAALLAGNCEVAIATRHAAEKRPAHPEVYFYEVDRADQQALYRCFNDFGADQVVDSICYEPRDAEALIQIVEGRVRQLVHISTVDVYGYPLSRLPFRESDPFHPPVGSYAAKKCQIEELYWKKYNENGFPVTIGRPTLSISPKFCPMMFFDWGWQAVSRMKAGWPVLVPGDGLGLMHVGWSYDVGRMVAMLLENERTLGEGYTLSAPDCLSRYDYISLFAKVLGVEWTPVYIPQGYLDSFPGVESISRIPHLYKENMAFELDKFARDCPAFRWTPLERGVEEFISENTFPAPRPDHMEERILQAWQQRLRGWGVDPTVIPEGEGKQASSL